MPKLLIDAHYRRRILTHVTDPAILSFFHFYETQNDRLREESIAPLAEMKKVNKHPEWVNS